MVQQNIHGGDIYRNQVSLDFSVNINPFGMPQRVREALEAAVAWCERYPDIRSEALRDAIAGEKGIAPEDIVCGNGASELFPAILRAVHAKRCCLPCRHFTDMSMRQSPWGQRSAATSCLRRTAMR